MVPAGQTASGQLGALPDTRASKLRGGKLHTVVVNVTNEIVRHNKSGVSLADLPWIPNQPWSSSMVCAPLLSSHSLRRQSGEEQILPFDLARHSSRPSISVWILREARSCVNERLRVGKVS